MPHLDNVAAFKSALKWCSILLILKVLASILSNYPDYFPPDFESDFLLGRNEHFFGVYCLSFYAHILSTPCALVSGLVLMNERFRKNSPLLHRRLGRIHVLGLLLLVVPSSLWMSAYASSGWIAGFGFGSLALATALCASMGWRRARERHFKKHRYWMTRCYLLLCSAVVLRLISGTASVFHLNSEWVYPVAAWACWIVPLLGLEICEGVRCKV